MIDKMVVVAIVLFILLVGFIYIDLIALIKYKKIVRNISNKELLISIAKVSDDWALLADGTSGNIQLEQHMLRGMQKIFSLFKQKNHDYGSANLSKTWIVGVIVRLNDKIERMLNLTRNNIQPLVKDESVVDTFMDVANYGIIGYLMADGKWPEYEKK